MTDSTIFGGNEEDKTSAATPTATTEASLLNALVGEKQKYKSVDDLAKAYANADEFIEKLKEENRQLREKAAAAATIDDVLDRIGKANELPQKDTSAQTLSKEDLVALVEQTVSGRETQRSREANLLKADKLMKEKFGEKAVEVFKQKAATPELAKVYMELASQAPEQFVSLFAPQTAPVTTGVDMGSVSTASYASSSENSSTTEWSKAWVADVRKKDPNRYWSAEFQYELQNKVIKNPSLYGFR